MNSVFFSAFRAVLFVLIIFGSACPVPAQNLNAVRDELSAVLPVVSALIPVVRPTQTDVNIIQMVATLGASETVDFPAGSDILQFIGQKCGRPSRIVAIHPTYLNILLAQNEVLKNVNLTSLENRTSVSLPACARFGNHVKPVLAGSGVYSLVASLSIPFDTEIFQTITKNKTNRTDLQKLGVDSIASRFLPKGNINEKTSAEINGISAEINGIIAKCKAKSEGDVDGYFACINAIDLIVNNSSLEGPDAFSGPLLSSAAVNANHSVSWVPLEDNFSKLSREELQTASKWAASGLSKTDILLNIAREKTPPTSVASHAGEVAPSSQFPVECDPGSRSCSLVYRPIVRPASFDGASYASVAATGPNLDVAGTQTPASAYPVSVSLEPAPVVIFSGGHGVAASFYKGPGAGTADGVVVASAEVGAGLKGVSGRDSGSLAGDSEPAIHFVKDVSEVSDFGDDCSKAETLRKGTWPFSVEKLIETLSLTDELSPAKASERTKTNILVVDSGFDFTPDKALDGRARVAFPPWYFNPVGPDPDGDQANNPLPLPINSGDKPTSSGVNLAGAKSLDSATSVYDTDSRSHGLAVTTLALGGREHMENLRHIVDLDIKVTEASLISKWQHPNDGQFAIDRGELADAVKLARSQQNQNIRVINLSLVSPTSLDDFKRDVEGANGLIIVSAAGNDSTPLPLKYDRGLWPASLGGQPNQPHAEASVFITVGAHDGADHWAKFSDYGAPVDLLAPGCRVPTYELDLKKANSKQFVLVPAYLNGTSFAAPIVTFAASLLSTFERFRTKPGFVKTRLILSTDYHFDLQGKAYSDGVLDIPKALSFENDVVEMEPSADERAMIDHEMHVGYITNTASIGDIICKGNEKRIQFSSVEKLSFDSRFRDKGALIFFNSDPAIPSHLEKEENCKFDELLPLQFTDTKSGKSLEVTFSDIIDYVRNMKTVSVTGQN
jgi:hypothetical protein